MTATLAFLAAAPHHANTGMEPCVGEISYVAFNYAPNGWLQCDGQILPINQYNALFSLLDTTYGGDGATNFKLPDMRGRAPLHQGRNLDGSAYSLGQMGGTENTTLTINQLPAHTHPVTAISTSTSAVALGATATSTLKAVNSDADQKTAGGNALANAKGLNSAYSSAAPNVSMNAASIETTLNGLGIVTNTNTTVDIGPTGNSQSFPNMQPYTVVNCIIAWQGVFPQRP
ncbi:tail fiber protein [Nitrosomonas sp. JL21]|uniref:phage tail protein n=1 Tax=Nitrosomonas sp. JL21 TaxID=153949 RepID=UPI001F04DA44|nr:tail fiber protein [Nitrosomonas sp. JL21]